jgi:hypothetical protein
VRSLKARWRHYVKVKKPQNIKRSNAKVSPKDVREFFERIGPNIEDIPASTSLIMMKATSRIIQVWRRPFCWWLQVSGDSREPQQNLILHDVLYQVGVKFSHYCTGTVP